MEMKKCNNCGEIKPFNSEYFEVRKDAKSGLRATCKDCQMEKRKKRYEENKERLSAQGRASYQKNKEKAIKRAREYYLTHKEQHVKATKKYDEKNKEYISLKKKEYREKNKAKLALQGRGYRAENKERITLKSREYYKENKEQIAGRHAKYYSDNRDKLIPKLRKYERDRRKTDAGFKLVKNLRVRLRLAIKNNTKGDSTKALLGCEIEYLKKYLELQFKDGMTWSNYGIGGWEIDHIKPCASFDLSDELQQQECFHYTNLQPMWADENRKKASVWENEYYEMGDKR